MKTFNLKSPCKDCPFRTDIRFYLCVDRVQEICTAITTQDQSFHCHKTTKHDDEGDVIPSKNEMHCAGAIIMLENMNRPNQMMRIAERLGFYDPAAMDMSAPVFKSAREMIEVYKRRKKTC